MEMRQDMLDEKADIVIRLRELRRLSGLSQKEVSLLSGVGEKTISSFETGCRIDTMKLGQLGRILKVYGVSESEFFGDEFDELMRDEEAFLSSSSVLRGLVALPRSIREGLLGKISLMVETAHQVHEIDTNLTFSQAPTGSDWDVMNSRN
jgi:transcriptional regulator with XRE-family HTH domain